MSARSLGAVVAAVLVAWSIGGCSNDEEPARPAGSGGSGAAGGGGSAGGTGKVFDAGSDPARNNVSAGAICDRFAEISCAGEDFCCSAPGRDRTACLADIGDTCKTALLLDAVSGNAITGFDAAKASTAFMGLETRASMCDPNIGAWGVSMDGFAGAVAGTLAAGADCTPAGGLLGQLSDIVAALASCMNPATTACLPGMDMNAPWTCQPRAAAGGACYSDLNCQDGLYCNPPFDVSGVCTGRKAMGETCLLATECQSFICLGGACADATPDNAYCPAQ